MMFRRGKTQKKDEDLDRIGRMLLRASSTNGSEKERPLPESFLYGRIRNRIEEKRGEQTEQEGGWLQLLLAARSAVPVMTAVSIIAICLFWVLGMHNSAPIQQGNN